MVVLNSTGETPASAVVVLDTNVVLDCLLFLDPAVAPLRRALEQGRLRWVVCPSMRQEFGWILKSPSLCRWNPDSEHLLTLFDRCTSLQPEPKPAPARLRCNDADDQVFLDLALASGARWLLSHDKALLRLRRRMPPEGPLICPPREWVAAAEEAASQEKGRPKPP